jgi:hypothetical protein
MVKQACGDSSRLREGNGQHNGQYRLLVSESAPSVKTSEGLLARCYVGTLSHGPKERWRTDQVRSSLTRYVNLIMTILRKAEGPRRVGTCFQGVTLRLSK